MLGLIKSEFIKSKGTSTNKFVIFGPVLCILLSTSLGGGQSGAYNWWYVMFLPGMLAIISSQVITREKKLSYKGILLYPAAREKVWLGKIIYIIILFVESNLIFMLGTMGLQFIDRPSITPLANALAALVLVITMLFQIPASLFLAGKFNMSVAVIFNLVMTTLGVVSFGSSSILVLSPYGISSALMVPILHILPNGLPAPNSGALSGGSRIILDSGVTLILFFILTLATMLWFRKREAK